MNNIFETGRIIQSQIDPELSNRLGGVYNISVICSEFSVAKMQQGKSQGKFMVLLDVHKSIDDTIKSLGSLNGVGNYGVDLNSLTYGEPFRILAQRLVKEYFDILKVEYKNYDELVVIVYEFNAMGINRIYGQACIEVKKYMNRNFNICMRDIVGFEDGKYFILVDELHDYNIIIKNKTNISTSIFEIMKKYDHFNLLKADELKINFLLKESLDHEELSSFLQRRTLY